LRARLDQLGENASDRAKVPSKRFAGPTAVRVGGDRQPGNFFVECRDQGGLLSAPRKQGLGDAMDDSSGVGGDASFTRLRSKCGERGAKAFGFLEQVTPFRFRYRMRRR
jgi:hypothetical protein